MLSAKKLMKVGNKWKKIAAAVKKGISFPRVGRPNSSSVADKGHFVIYTKDGRLFAIPLAYLSSNIFKELFRISKEDFGLSGEGPIRMPCDYILMEYIVTVIRKGLSRELEKVLLGLLVSACSSCSTAAVAFHQGQPAQQDLVCC